MVSFIYTVAWVKKITKIQKSLPKLFSDGWSTVCSFFIGIDIKQPWFLMESRKEEMRILGALLLYSTVEAALSYNVLTCMQSVWNLCEMVLLNLAMCYRCYGW